MRWLPPLSPSRLLPGSTLANNHFIFVYPAATCWFGGLGTAGPLSPTAAIPHQYTNIFLPVTPKTDYTNPSTLDFLWFANAQHEFGHGLGMSHSNSLDFGALSLGPLDFTQVTPGTISPGDSPTTAPAAPSNALISAINTEYADDFSDMGNFQGRYNGQHATQILGWIPASGTQDVTASGSFTLAPTETNAGLRDATHFARPCLQFLDMGRISPADRHLHSPVRISEPVERHAEHAVQRCSVALSGRLQQ